MEWLIPSSMASVWLIIYHCDTYGMEKGFDNNILGYFPTEEDCKADFQSALDDFDADQLTYTTMFHSEQVDPKTRGCADRWNLADDWHTLYPEVFELSCIGTVEDPNTVDFDCICFQEVKSLHE